MKLNVLEQSKDKIKIEMKGESTTFANLIKKELWKNENIDFAAVVKKHPYMSEPELTLKTVKGSPEKLIEDAAETLVDNVKALKKQASDYMK